MRSYHRLLCSTSCGSCLPREYQPNITPSVRAVHLHPNIVILFPLEVSVFHGPRVSCYWSWEREPEPEKTIQMYYSGTAHNVGNSFWHVHYTLFFAVWSGRWFELIPSWVINPPCNPWHAVSFGQEHVRKEIFL